MKIALGVTYSTLLDLIASNSQEEKQLPQLMFIVVSMFGQTLLERK